MSAYLSRIFGFTLFGYGIGRHILPEQKIEYTNLNGVPIVKVTRKNFLLFDVNRVFYDPDNVKEKPFVVTKFFPYRTLPIINRNTFSIKEKI